MNKLKLLVVMGVIGVVTLSGTKAYMYYDGGTGKIQDSAELLEESDLGTEKSYNTLAMLKQDEIIKGYTVPTPTPSPTPTPEVSESKDYTKWDNKGSASGKMVFECTAYCNCIKCCGKYSPEAGGKGTTFSGTYPKEGRTIATDPSVIPIGTKVVINGNVYTAEDTGSAIKGRRIDIFFDSHKRCNDFGRRKLKVRILK